MNVREFLCVGCGSCVEFCPVGAVSLTDGKPNFDEEKCVHCGACISRCPFGAIRENEE